MTSKFFVKQNYHNNYSYIAYYNNTNPITIFAFPSWQKDKDYMFAEFEENIFKLLGNALVASTKKIKKRIFRDGGWMNLYYIPEEDTINIIDDEGNASKGQSYSEFVSECIELLDFINTLKAEKGVK